MVNGRVAAEESPHLGTIGRAPVTLESLPLVPPRTRALEDAARDPKTPRAGSRRVAGGIDDPEQEVNITMRLAAY